MGYETTLIFVKDWGGKKGGYKSIIATIDMSKVCYEKVGEVIRKNSFPEDQRSAIKANIEQYRNMWDEIYNKEGGYTEKHEKLSKKTQDKKTDRLYKFRREIERHVPLIYYGGCGEKGSFADDYGDPLTMIDLEEIREAIVHNQIIEINRDISQGELPTGYRRFVLALNLIEGFRTAFPKGSIKVIAWGH